jgi:hypothetical protein
LGEVAADKLLARDAGHLDRRLVDVGDLASALMVTRGSRLASIRLRAY